VAAAAWAPGPGPGGKAIAALHIRGSAVWGGGIRAGDGRAVPSPPGGGGEDSSWRPKGREEGKGPKPSVVFVEIAKCSCHLTDSTEMSGEKDVFSRA